jgi:hypothetical protein
MMNYIIILLSIMCVLESPIAKGLGDRLAGRARARGKDLERLLRDPEVELVVRKILEEKEQLRDEQLLEAAAEKLLEDPEMFERVTRRVQEKE